MTSTPMNAGSSGLLDGDVVAVERTEVPRKVVGMPGCFVINRICDSDGRPRLFQCSIAKFLPAAITINASVKAMVGDWMVEASSISENSKARSCRSPKIRLR